MLVSSRNRKFHNNLCRRQGGGMEIHMKLIAFGEVIWDRYESGDVIGGAPFNFCGHVAHFGDEAYILSAVGNDDLGDRAIDAAKKFGIRTDLLQRNQNETGACIVTLDENKVPNYNVLTNTAYDRIVADEKVISGIRSLDADVFYFGTLIQRDPVSRGALETILEKCSFREIFCDINIRKNCFDKESLELCFSKATVIKISDEEAHYIYDLGFLDAGEENLPAALCDKYKNLKTVIFTLGSKGSLVYDAATGATIPSPKPSDVKVVSTVGAGDSFGASFLHFLMAGESYEVCLAEATKTSDFVVAHKDAIPY